MSTSTGVLNVNREGKLSLTGPGRADDVTLKEFRAKRRLQELVFDLARALARDFLAQGHSEVPPHVLFPQLAAIVQQYIDTRVTVHEPANGNVVDDALAV